MRTVRVSVCGESWRKAGAMPSLTTVCAPDSHCRSLPPHAHPRQPEKLQGLCTSMLLAAEQAEYVEEGVPWTPIEFVDNEATLAAFERRAGLLGMLHEEATLQQGGDATLHGKLKAALNDDACFSMPSAAGARGQFVVKHFTGDAVVYDTQGMVEKARQTLPPDLEALLDDVLPLQREDAPTGGSAASGGGGIRASKRGSATGRKGNRRVGSTVLQFKAQLASLHSALAASQLSFVRCVKPNAANKPDCFDDEYCKPQVLQSSRAFAPPAGRYACQPKT